MGFDQNSQILLKSVPILANIDQTLAELGRARWKLVRYLRNVAHTCSRPSFVDFGPHLGSHHNSWTSELAGSAGDNFPGRVASNCWATFEADIAEAAVKRGPRHKVPPTPTGPEWDTHTHRRPWLRGCNWPKPFTAPFPCSGSRNALRGYSTVTAATSRMAPDSGGSARAVNSWGRPAPRPVHEGPPGNWR